MKNIKNYILFESINQIKSSITSKYFTQIAKDTFFVTWLSNNLFLLMWYITIWFWHIFYLFPFFSLRRHIIIHLIWGAQFIGYADLTFLRNVGPTRQEVSRSWPQSCASQVTSKPRDHLWPVLLLRKRNIVHMQFVKQQGFAETE